MMFEPFALTRDIQQCFRLWPMLIQLSPQFCNEICSFLVLKSRHGDGGGVLTITLFGKVYRYFVKNQKYLLEELIELRGKAVSSLHTGLNYQLALTWHGLVFAWGENQYGQIGDGTNVQCSKPKMVQFDPDDFGDSLVTMVRCGDSHSAALTRDGQVYCWGRNLAGQCGVGNKDDVNKPVKVIILEEMKVTRIECGRNHTLVLTNLGEVFAWGCNQFGQLGIGPISNQNVPVRVIIAGCDTPIKQIACGPDHSLLMTTEGQVFGFGDNHNGQVGCNLPSLDKVYEPLLIDCPNRFKSIAVYGGQSVALCQNGFCFVWGLVGEMFTRHKVHKPRQTDCTSMQTAIGNFIRECTLLIQVRSKLQTTYPQLKCAFASLANSFNQQEFSDLEFVVQGRSIYAHRSILRITSPYFRRMLSDTWSQTDLIEIPDQSYSYPVYLAYLRFLYTDSTEIYPEFLPELLDLSVSYFESLLTQHCTELLSLSITLENSSQFYLLSVQYELAEFERFVLEFIAANLLDVYQSTAGFQSMSEDHCKELMAKLKYDPSQLIN